MKGVKDKFYIGGGMALVVEVGNNCWNASASVAR
jgi:hypothetical protein